MPFRLFGLDQLAALAATGAAAFALVRRARRNPAPRVLRFGLAAVLAAAASGWLAFVHARYGLSLWDLLPLHLCDFLILVAVWALVTLRPLACELLYFWSAGTLLAMVTPDLGVGFPHPAFVAFFTLHGAVVVSAALVVFGLGRRPRPGAAWRAFGATLAYAGVVALVNLAFGTNFLFLCRKPDEPTLLDAFGPWPAYLGTVALFALGLFHLMAWPLRERPASPWAGAGPSPP